MPKAKPKLRTNVSYMAINTKSTNRGASMVSQNGVTSVTHKEVVQESLIATSTFGVNTTISIQPAISTYSHGSPLGTWLPKIAAEYDHYEFEKLKLHFVPTCATTQAGLVIMAVDPNPEGLQPDSFSSMKNIKNAVSGPVRERLVLDIMPVIGRKKLLTRDSAVTSYPLYDVGRAFIATTAGSGVSVGYVEVEYTVRLTNPQTGPRTEALVSAAVVYPGIYYSGNASIGTPGTQRWFGTTNANRAAMAYMNDIINNATYKAGHTTLAPITSVARSATLSWVGPYTGITYSVGNGWNMPFWTMNLAGRYRFTAKLPGDWQNYATFGSEIVSWGVAGDLGGRNPATDLPAASVDYVRGGAGDLQIIPTTYSGWRGLRSTVTGGTDDDDFVPEVDITFSALGGERFTLFIGVRNDTNISENADAWLLYDSRAGLPQAKLEYLGTL